MVKPTKNGIDMLSKISLKSLKKITDKDLEKTWSVLEDSIKNVKYEYYRRQAMEIKRTDPEYYMAHFKKYYG